MSYLNLSFTVESQLNDFFELQKTTEKRTLSYPFPSGTNFHSGSFLRVSLSNSFYIF